MPVGDQDRGGIAMAATVVLRGLHQPVNLAFCEIVAASMADCYIFYRRSLIEDMLILHGSRAPIKTFCYTSIWKCNSVEGGSPQISGAA